MCLEFISRGESGFLCLKYNQQANKMNYKKVIEDFNNGTIDPLKFQVCMDNDGGYWEYIGEGDDYDNQDLMLAEMTKKYGCPDGYKDIVDVLNAAGVTADWC